MDADALAQMRLGYSGPDRELIEADVAKDPFAQFEIWFAEALQAGLVEPNAMVLATADAAGVASARTVLLKSFDEWGFVFFTNYGSRKAAELTANPRATLLFPWHVMRRQVIVSGPVERITHEESAAYFRTRPYDSRIGAWSSPQSQVIASRAWLEERYAEVAVRWPEDGDVPAPDFWGGYRVKPVSVEFWQGRAGRLHDRLRYQRSEDDWIIERLAP